MDWTGVCRWTKDGRCSGLRSPCRETSTQSCSLRPWAKSSVGWRTFSVEREAAPMVQQMVAMAKAEAAMFVHEPGLAEELLGRVWTCS